MSHHPSNPSSQVSPRRLLDAADALVNAVNDPHDKSGQVQMWTGDASHAPRDSFTAMELMEALAFLHRIGMFDQHSANELT